VTAIACTRQTLSLFQSHSLPESRTIADLCQLHTVVHHYSILHDVRELTIVGREWYRPSTAGQCSCARLHRDCATYTTTCSIIARPYTSPVAGHTAPKELVAVAVARLHRPPSSVRSKSTSPSGPSSSSVDTPTVTQYQVPLRTARHPLATSHPRNTHTQPSKLTSTPLHTHTSSIDVSCSA